jgi:hypothetical protein
MLGTNGCHYMNPRLHRGGIRVKQRLLHVELLILCGNDTCIGVATNFATIVVGVTCAIQRGHVEFDDWCLSCFEHRFSLCSYAIQAILRTIQQTKSIAFYPGTSIRDHIPQLTGPKSRLCVKSCVRGCCLASRCLYLP